MRKYLFLIQLILSLIFIQPDSVVGQGANVGGNSEVTPEVDILEENPPRGSPRVVTLANNVKEIHGLVGENIVMECQVFNKAPDAPILWKRIVNNQVEIISDTFKSRDQSKYRVGQGKQIDSVRLEIMSLDMVYEGNYSCEVQYSGSIDPAKSIRTLRVYEAPRIKLDTSSFNTVAKLGEPVTLKCEATGIPKPQFTWIRVGGESSLIRDYGMQVVGSAINFESVSAEDVGTYQCTARNELNSVIWNVDLKVYHEPIVSIYPVEGAAKQKVGCRYELICTINADPPVAPENMIWSADNVVIKSSDSGRLRVNHLQVANGNIFNILSFEPVQKEDLNKVYKCVAQNTIASKADQVTLRESDVVTPSHGGLLTCAASSLNISPLLAVWLAVIFVFLLR